MKKSGRWQAWMSFQGKGRSLGTFDAEEGAARASDAEAKRLWVNPVLNFLPDGSLNPDRKQMCGPWTSCPAGRRARGATTSLPRLQQWRCSRGVAGMGSEVRLVMGVLYIRTVRLILGRRTRDRATTIDRSKTPRPAHEPEPRRAGGQDPSKAKAKSTSNHRSLLFSFITHATGPECWGRTLWPPQPRSSRLDSPSHSTLVVQGQSMYSRFNLRLLIITIIHHQSVRPSSQLINQSRIS